VREADVEASSARVAVERSRTESRDLGEVEDLINRRYVNHRPRLLGHSRQLMFRSQAAWAGGLTVDTMTYGPSLAIDTDPFDTILAIGMIEGRFDLTTRRDTGRAGRGESLLYPLGTPLGVFMDRVTFSVTQLPIAAVTRLAGRLGVGAADFRIDGMAPVSPALNRHWLATTVYLARSFAGPDPAAAHPLVLGSVVEAAAAAVLAVFPNTTMRVGYTGSGRVAPAAVRRAVAFVDANAEQPITLEDIAAASGITARGLQAAFARHRDTTPMGYLRRVRMERAHRDLQAGDRTSGDTVVSISRRWGFGSPGRFAVDYRKVFGRSPGETLEI
jgi:AraC-like DNA-binding protein